MSDNDRELLIIWDCLGLRSVGLSKGVNSVSLLVVILLPVLFFVACARQAEQSLLSEASPASELTLPVVITKPADANSAVTTGSVVVTISQGSEARYLIKEQLVRRNFPNDAIGKTSKVEGSIVFDPNGDMRLDSSRIIVDMSTLQSDSDRRDNYVHRNTLETNRFQTAEFVIREIPGFPWPLPNVGNASFKLVGDMDLHGEKAPLIWDVMAEFDGNEITGLAKTSFRLDKFNLSKPRVAIVLSVEENVRLELDFIASISFQD